MHGYLAAMSQAGLRVAPELVSHGTFVTATGVGEGRRLLALEQPPTAVFAANDAIAVGVIEGLHGLAVPAELSVVGFDDTVLAESSTPPLTTVRQSLQDLGAYALKTLLSLGDGVTPGLRHVELATELVIRSSTGAPAPSNCRAQPPGRRTGPRSARPVGRRGGRVDHRGLADCRGSSSTAALTTSSTTFR